MKGHAEITIEADPQTRLKNVSGYYVAQATNGISGTVHDRWGSITVRSDETRLLVLDVGLDQRLRFVPLSPLTDDALHSPPDDFPAENANCSLCDLRRRDLRNLKLIQYGFYGANLTGADFRGSDMYEVDFRNASGRCGCQWSEFEHGGLAWGKLHRSCPRWYTTLRCQSHECNLARWFALYFTFDRTGC